MPPFSYTGNDPFIKSILKAYSNAELARIRAQTALRGIVEKSNQSTGGNEGGLATIRELALSGMDSNACPLCLVAGTPLPDEGGPHNLSCPKCQLSWATGEVGQKR